VLLYVLLDRVSYVHPMIGTNITPWNPQAALAAALLARSPGSWWLALLTIVSAAWSRSAPALVSMEADVAAAAQVLGYVATAAALRRWLGPQPWVARRADYLRFLPIAVAGAALSSALCVGALVALGWPAVDRVLTAFLRAAIGDSVSLVVSPPVVLALAGAERRAQGLAMLRLLEWWLIAGAAVLAAYAVFVQPAQEQFKYFYLLFLPVAWGAARFGNVGAVWSAALVQALLILAVQGSGYRPLDVFELHMLIESRRSSKPGGMGVGLAISRSIVEAHEGRLWAEPGPGGRLFFTLPLGSGEGHE
jgi:integral membrane sensor domain MASE1